MKFKVGDKVVVTFLRSNDAEKLHNQTAQVTKVYCLKVGNQFIYQVDYRPSGVYEDELELVQEEQVKFKAGDKVRVRSGAPCTIIAPGTTATIVDVYKVPHSNCYITIVSDVDRASYDVLSKHLELAEEAKSELQELVDKANAGHEARQRLFEKYVDQVDYKHRDNDQWFTSFSPIELRDFSRELRIKPKPKFEPYTIKSTGWNVDLEGNSDNIKIGCRSFHITTLKSALESLLNNHVFDTDVHTLSLAASRKGVHEGQHILPWADVEELYEKLKKAGV